MECLYFISKNGINGISRNFERLIEKLKETYHSSNVLKKLGGPSGPGPLGLTERHFPEVLQTTEKKLLFVETVLFVAVKGMRRDRKEEMKLDIRYRK